MQFHCCKGMGVFLEGCTSRSEVLRLVRPTCFHYLHQHTYKIAGGSGQSSIRPTSSRRATPAQTTSVDADQLSSSRILSQPGRSLSSVPNTWSDLPGIIPGCTSTQTAVVFGTTTYIPRPCLSGGNGPNTVPGSTLNDKGPPPNIPRPQSTADGLGSAGGLMSAGPAGSYAPKPSAPTTPLQPVQKPSIVEPKPTPTAMKPVGEHMGGKGGMPVPRPESSVTDLGSPEPTTAQAAPPAQSSAQSDGGGRVPRPESSVKHLEPVKASSFQPVAPSPSRTDHADHFPISHVQNHRSDRLGLRKLVTSRNPSSQRRILLRSHLLRLIVRNHCLCLHLHRYQFRQRHLQSSQSAALH